MTTLTIRQKLMTYVADAGDNKIKALYTPLEKEILEEEAFTLTDDQLKILDDEHDMYMNGKSKFYNREEAKLIIKGQRAF